MCVEFIFATSHGKSVCDGIGGTIKRLAAKASLQHQACGQIVNAEEMFKFCKTEIKSRVQQVLSLSMVSIGQFVLCTYDGHKWVGMAFEVNMAHKDIEIKFMHSSCPTRSYTWSRCDDICWVPITNILFY